MRLRSAPGSFISHCHTTKTRHPETSSWCRTVASRSILRANFAFQNLARVLGLEALLHPGWRCQKHPCTKITERRRGKTRSGLPGRVWLCTLNLYPSECAILRTAISGIVSWARTRDIRKDRRVGVNRSIWQGPLQYRRRLSNANCHYFN
jgi:hypothetical protein